MWYVHAQIVLKWPTELLRDVDRFFDFEARRWTLWARMFNVEDVLEGQDRVTPGPHWTPQNALPLFYMSLLGLTDRLRDYRERGYIEYIRKAPNKLDTNFIHPSEYIFYYGDSIVAPC
jgi:hypothetical protein